MTPTPLGWFGIVRLGLVQAALGAVVVLTTSTLNRVMVVELALPAMLPAGLVAWHYALQLSRPRWGYGSDMGGRRTPWIIGGMGVLSLGGVLATDAALMIPSAPVAGFALAVVAFSLIGAGVGAAGTSLLALLATRAAPERRPAAAAITWILMIVGFIVTTAVSAPLLDPFSPQRLAFVAGGVSLVAFLLALVAVAGVEGRAAPAAAEAVEAKPSFSAVLKEVWAEPQARRFTLFVALAMVAYSLQELILEPFAGLVFGFTVAQSTALASVQNQGALLGMILVGVVATTLAHSRAGSLRLWTIGGCAASALALAGLALGATVGGDWPLRANVFLLGLGNGAFAVAAIGSMMALAGEGRAGREGARMGLWGASQAVAMAAGGFLGAAGVDLGRSLLAADAPAFGLVFLAEGALFLVAAVMAAQIRAPSLAALRARAAAPADLSPQLAGG
jgi:MFS transporter, BCD family, chlorophyll transporter